MYLIDSFTDLKKYKQIDSLTLITILEFSIRNTVIKKYKYVQNLDIFIDYENGSIDIWRNRIIVGEIQESNKEIDIPSAKQIELDLEEGEEITEQFILNILDRRHVLTFKYNFYLKNKEYYNILMYNNFNTKIGDIVIGEVINAKKDLIIRDDNHNDFFLPKTEQMFNDFMRKKESIRAIIKNVYWEESQPIIILSRTGPNFVLKLLEQEIPEILDGFIIVKQVVRIPGEKSKISVKSSDSHIDPILACLGVKGIRLNAIVKELKTENIDVIKYTSSTKLYLLRALSPTKISMIELYEQNKKAMISLKYEQVARAIGRKGKNIRLAGKITGYKINILRNYYYSFNKYEEEISKFLSEISLPIYDALKFNNDLCVVNG